MLVTTSRHPTPPIRRTARELAALLYNAVRINRGGLSEAELYAKAKSIGAKRVVIIGRGRGGNPGRVVFVDTSGEEPVKLPLILSLRGVIYLGRVPRASSETPITWTRSGGELCEELSIALDVPCIGKYSSGVHREYGRVVVVEKGGGKISYVIKFLEVGREVGLKLLVERLVWHEWK